MQNNIKDEELTEATAREISERYIESIPPFPDIFEGRGIVICAGGLHYFTNAWVCINMLRRLGCTLPIELWHRGPEELNQEMRSLVEPLNVKCVDAFEVRKKHPVRILNGWEIKPYSILHSPFEEVLLLDADNVPVLNPERLFETSEYQTAGAIFWPDYHTLDSTRKIWEICGVSYIREPEFESGQVLTNKRKCWKALNLCMWYNEHSDFYYRYIHGDKETFHMAFRKTETQFSMPQRGIYSLLKTMCQHDLKGNRVFQHRNMDKWNLFSQNKRIKGFLFEDECLEYINHLRSIWSGTLNGVRRFNGKLKNAKELDAAGILTSRIYDYNRVGRDHRRMSFLPDGTIGAGTAGCEVFWDVKSDKKELYLDISSEKALTCSLKYQADQRWTGRWVGFEKMPVILSPDLSDDLSSCSLGATGSPKDVMLISRQKLSPE